MTQNRMKSMKLMEALSENKQLTEDDIKVAKKLKRKCEFLLQQ